MVQLFYLCEVLLHVEELLAVQVLHLYCIFCVVGFVDALLDHPMGTLTRLLAHLVFLEKQGLIG